MNSIIENNNWKSTFILLWIGQFFSLISSAAVNFAIIIYLSIETQSAEVLAFSAISGLLPQALIGPFAGVFIDRWNRKNAMMYADGFVAICTLVMSLSFYLGFESLILIYVLLALRSVGSAFHMPAMQASIPLLAPESELLRIAGINQIIQSISNIAGPAIGALAIGLLPIGTVLLLDVVGAVFAITTLLFIAIPNPIKKDKNSSEGLKQVWEDLHLGFNEIHVNKGLRMLFFYSVVAMFCIMPVAVLFPLLTIQHFNGGKFEMSIVEVAWGVGMLVGGSVLGIWKPQFKKVILINFMNVIIGITFTWSGLLNGSQFVLFAVLTAIGGVAAAMYNASFTTIIQEQVKPNMLGRVFSLYYSVTIIPSVFGLLSTGFVADFIGIEQTFIWLGIVVSLMGVFAFFTPSLMRLEK